MSESEKVMISPIAGQWYSGHEGSLRRDIEELRKGLMPVRRKNICAAADPCLSCPSVKIL